MKKKIIKNMKRLIVLCLVLSLNINTYAAISGNDGSAFVSKTEFDAFVNTFNDQMNSYEASIVSKIDGSILNYLNSLSSEVTEKIEVGYLKIVPSNYSTITMQPYNAFSYSGGRPNVYFNGVMGSTYKINYAFAGYAYINYTGADNGYRRFVTQNGSTYRWQGYTTNYRETHNITWGGNQGSFDTGFDSTNYIYVPYSTKFSTTESTTGTYWNLIYWRLGDSYQGHGMFSPSSCTSSTTFNNYTVTNSYDLIYSDYSTKTANNMRCFVPGNPNNRWFAGASVNYLNVTSGASRGGSARVNVDNSIYNASLSSYNYYSYGAYYNTPFYTCGFEPNITSWSKVYNADTTLYEYKDHTGVKHALENYSMIAGACFGAVRAGAYYEWPIEFNTTSDTTVWLKYDQFDGAPVTADCIPVSVDGGPKYNSATIKDGKGVITFTAESNGLVFFKWTSGRALKVQPSKTVTCTYEEE